MALDDFCNPINSTKMSALFYSRLLWQNVFTISEKRAGNILNPYKLSGEEEQIWSKIEFIVGVMTYDH